MDPSILNYKYNDLRQVAKDLGLNNFGEYSGMPTRDQLIDAIKAYYENDGKPEVVKKKKTKKTTKSNENQAEQDVTRDISATRQTRRTTRIATEITNEISNQAQPQQQEIKEDEQVGKKKKRTKKIDKENVPAKENPETTESIKPVKKTKNKKSEASLNQNQQVVELESTNKTTNDKELKSKTKKKTKQVEVEKSIETTASIETTSTAAVLTTKTAITKTKIKKTKTKKTAKIDVSKTKVVDSNSNDIIYDTNTNQSDEFQLKLDEDEDSQSRQQSQKQQPEEQVKSQDNLSLITNDDESSQNQLENDDLNTNKDVLNRTFDKADSTNGRLVSANIKPFYIEETTSKQDNQSANQTEAVSCNSFYNNNNNNNNNNQLPEQKLVESENKLKVGSGARIVRPKQTQTVAVKADTDKEETKKVVVELIQREAGPRIVKPQETDDPKHRNNTDNTKATKKAKETKKAPDFKAIHEKNFEKLESVSDNQHRLQHRHKILTTVNKTPSNETKSKLPPSATISHDLNKPETKTTNTAATPKIIKTKSSYSIMSSTQKVTNLPRLMNNNKEVVKKPVEPKTPGDERKSMLAKTPQSSIRPKTSFLLQSATKKPSYAFSHENQNLNQINFSSGCAFNAAPPAVNNLLATSSFIRRKSFDLNASLARPITYKRHTGKLKPIELSTKTNNHLKTINMNETITKTVTSALSCVSAVSNLKSTSDTKRKSLLKQRELFKSKTTNSNENQQDENRPIRETTSKTNESLKIKRKKKFDEKRNLNEKQAAVV